MKRFVGIILLTLAADQLSKFLIDKFVPYGASIPIIKPLHFFYITKTHNTGIAFSLFQNSNVFFIVIVSLFLITLMYYMYKNLSKMSVLQKHCLSIVIGGGLGNLSDRIFRGAVLDFLDFGISSFRWPSFNIADSSICVCAILIFVDTFILSNKNIRRN